MHAPIVTRFAPSPTGFMHIGGMRTALFAWMFARKHGGTFILRIEDTDKEREVAGSIEHIMESLRWLGLQWDYGPDKPGTFGSCIQSQRLDTYGQAAERLVAAGLAYPDPYSAEEVDALRSAAQAEKRAFLFRDHRPKEFGQWDGARPLRFKVPEVRRYRWHDEVRGELEAGEEALDDFILIKSDGYPTYNFAHIVDDANMGVTHVFRADEFISSTPKFLSLYDALGIAVPKFVTLPPILREDKTKKLGKRDGAKDILEYRSEGYLPEAFVNALAFIGWNPGTEQEIFSREELIAAFDISGIQIHGGVFNEEKFRWFNKEHLAHLDDAAFARYIEPAVPEELRERTEPLRHLLPILRERTALSGELAAEFAAGEYAWAYEPPAPDPARIAWKESTREEAATHLTTCRTLLEALPSEAWSDAAAIKSALWEYAENAGEGKGKGAVLWPLRYALTGKEKSPDPFSVALIIGKDETLTRVDGAINILRSV